MASCPFSSLWTSKPSREGAPVGKHDSLEQHAAPSSAEAGCPFVRLRVAKGDGSKALEEEEEASSKQSPSTARAEGEAGAAKCPYGFGASAPGRSQLSELHCMLCRALLFECASTACGHSYCGRCIAPFSDCPACGADVHPVVPNPELQGARARLNCCVPR